MSVTSPKSEIIYYIQLKEYSQQVSEECKP